MPSCLCTGALLSLCLLAQVYDHTLGLITRMAALPLGAEVLVQVRAVAPWLLQGGVLCWGELPWLWLWGLCWLQHSLCPSV